MVRCGVCCMLFVLWVVWGVLCVAYDLKVVACCLLVVYGCGLFVV